MHDRTSGNTIIGQPALLLIVFVEKSYPRNRVVEPQNGRASTGKPDRVRSSLLRWG